MFSDAFFDKAPTKSVEFTQFRFPSSSWSLMASLAELCAHSVFHFQLHNWSFLTIENDTHHQKMSLFTSEMRRKVSAHYLRLSFPVTRFRSFLAVFVDISALISARVTVLQM